MGVDRDEDSLLNGVETNTGTFVDGDDTGTDPALADTDGDGFDDDVEVASGRDPTDPLDFPGGPIAPASLPALGKVGSGVLVAAMLAAAWAGLRRRRV
jgi:hypothetical protein